MSVTVEYEANRRGSHCEPQEGSEKESRARTLQASCLSLHIRVHAAEKAELWPFCLALLALTEDLFRRAEPGPGAGWVLAREWRCGEKLTLLDRGGGGGLTHLWLFPTYLYPPGIFQEFPGLAASIVRVPKPASTLSSLLFSLYISLPPGGSPWAL